jgi:hypothetical protein
LLLQCHRFSPNSYDFYHNSAEKEFEYEIRYEIYFREQLSAKCTHRIGLKNFYSNSFIEEATFLANKPKYMELMNVALNVRIMNR